MSASKEQKVSEPGTWQVFAVLIMCVQEERKWRMLSSAETTGKFSTVETDKTDCDLTYSVLA